MATLDSEFDSQAKQRGGSVLLFFEIGFCLKQWNEDVYCLLSTLYM